MDIVNLVGRLEALVQDARASVRETGEASADAESIGIAVTSTEQFHELFARMQLDAVSSIDALDNGDYCDDTRGQSPSQAQALTTGVTYRVVYATSIFEADAHLEATLDSIDQGEIARVSDLVPLRCLIRDRAEVFIISRGYPDVEHLGFHSTHPLVVGYAQALFEMVWRRALPATEHRLDALAAQLTPEQTRLLKYLVLGRTDANIAQSLGVSMRTVQRQIRVLQMQLGTHGRFHLGVQIGRHLAAQNAPARPFSVPRGA